MIKADLHNSLILREAFYNRKAFLTFVYSPDSITMRTYYPSYGGTFPFAVVFFLFILPLSAKAQSHTPPKNFEYYLNRAQADSLSFETRKRLLKLSYQLIKHNKEDSLHYARISKIVEASSPLKDSAFFHQVAAEGLRVAENLNNPALLGDAHWNYAAYYLREKKYESSYIDYNRAYTYFRTANNKFLAGKMLYNMAFIASQTNDFTGAEILLFRSIKLFDGPRSIKQRYLCYNLLGTDADDMEEFEKSLGYYTKAGILLTELEDREYYQLENWNNLGVRLTMMGKHAQALPYFEKALTYRDILTNNPYLYAKLLDNSAFCRVQLGAYKHVEAPMHRALALRDSIDDPSGMVVSLLRFANYYGKIGDTLQAIPYAKQGLKLAKENHLTRDVLKALERLAVLDTAHALFYLQQHIELDKSLNARDRNLRNKFTAIQYETDKYIQQNERLFRQRLWISIAAIILTLILLLIYWNARQRARNKELLFEREQQQYNEDMFLMALNQKTNLEKGKSEERQRISQELHDDIVSRLFTLRLRWLSVKLAGEPSMLSLHKQFLALLEQLETDIKNLSYELREVVFFQEESFLAMLETIGHEKSEIGKFEFYFHCKEPEVWEGLPYVTQIHLRRLFEEVLHNVVKHAQATKVNAHLERELDILHISLKDNGKGFNQIAIKKGIGYKSLATRSQKLHGKFDIQSILEVGTTVSIQFPFNPPLI